MTSTMMAVQCVPRLWPGSTVVCIGGGPSLTAEDVAFCQGKARVIAINDAYRLAPWADVLYACDAKWWNWHEGVPSFHGLKYALDNNGEKWPDVQGVKNTGDYGLETRPHGIKHGKNSGYQAIGLAVHLGAARIVLLGYDMALGPKKERHWFGEHPQGVQSGTPFLVFRDHYRSIAEPLRALGIDVVNCSRRTTLDMFPRMTLEQAL